MSDQPADRPPGEPSAPGEPGEPSAPGEPGEPGRSAGRPGGPPAAVNGHLPGENTRAVHLPPAPVPAQQPLGTPVYRTAAFAFSSSAEYAALLNGETAGYSYSRIDNPTTDAFATAVAALEGQGLAGPTAAQGFASGMAAISAVFWTFSGAGIHVIAPAAVYGGTYGFLRHVAARFGVETDFVDVTDTDQVRAALRPETRIVAGPGDRPGGAGSRIPARNSGPIGLSEPGGL